jgi:hypothetical protein
MQWPSKGKQTIQNCYQADEQILVAFEALSLKLPRL